MFITLLWKSVAANIGNVMNDLKAIIGTVTSFLYFFRSSSFCIFDIWLNNSKWTLSSRKKKRIDNSWDLSIPSYDHHYVAIVIMGNSQGMHCLIRHFNDFLTNCMSKTLFQVIPRWSSNFHENIWRNHTLAHNKYHTVNQMEENRYVGTRCVLFLTSLHCPSQDFWTKAT